MNKQIISQLAQTNDPNVIMQFLQKLGQNAEQFMQALGQMAQQGDPDAQQAMQNIQSVIQQAQQQQAQSARFGAKLNYIKYLNGKCPDGYEMKIFRKGGKFCKKCMKKQGGGEIEEEETPLFAPKKKKSMIDDWRKNRMAKKDACGGKVKKKK